MALPDGSAADRYVVAPIGSVEDTLVLGAAVLLVNDDREYLLHLRDDIPGICNPGAWSLIGGNCEPGEPAEAAVHRELEEEAGLRIADLAPFTLASNVGLAGQTGYIQVFRGRWNGDAAALPIGEGIMFCWFAAPMVPRLRMCPWAQRVIDCDREQAMLPPR